MKSLLLGAVILFSSLILFSPLSAKAQVEQKDITNDVVKHLKKHFVGHSVSDGPTVIKRHRPTDPVFHTPLPGWEDRAKGSAKIESLSQVDGKILRINIPEMDLSFVTADIKMVFVYSGQTSCDRISAPGGLVVDHPWKSLHPKGTIKLHLRLEKQKNGKLTSNIFVNENHGDRPNAYIRDHLARRLATKGGDILQDYLGVQID
jgi:hypothetical protein